MVTASLYYGYYFNFFVTFVTFKHLCVHVEYTTYLSLLVELCLPKQNSVLILTYITKCVKSFINTFTNLSRFFMFANIDNE